MGVGQRFKERGHVKGALSPRGKWIHSTLKPVTWSSPLGVESKSLFNRLSALVVVTLVHSHINSARGYLMGALGTRSISGAILSPKGSCHLLLLVDSYTRVYNYTRTPHWKQFNRLCIRTRIQIKISKASETT